MKENIRKYKDMNPDTRDEQWYIDQYNRNRQFTDHIDKPRISPGTQWDKKINPNTQWDKYPTQEDVIEFNNKKNKESEMVDHPTHYGGEENPYEAIKVIEAWELGFNLGNAVKYIARVGKKENTLEDLKKSEWYINREIKKLKNER